MLKNGEFKNFAEVLEKVKSLPCQSLCVAAAEDEEVLQAVKMAQDMGLVKPVLTGNAAVLNELVKKIGLKDCRIVDCKTPEEAAVTGAKLVRDGEAQILMKGMVNTSVYMRAVLNKETGLRGDSLLSLLAAYELPNYDKLIFGSDSGINTAPTLDQKRMILNNALTAMKALGYTDPKVAALAANEMVDPKISATADADALVKEVTSGTIQHCIIEGPIAFDVVFDPHAAEHKGIKSAVSGDVDLLLFPNIEAGNILGKSWLHFLKAKWAGVVLGGTSPVILGSRSDSAEIKINSIAMGALIAAGSK